MRRFLAVILLSLSGVAALAQAPDAPLPPAEPQAAASPPRPVIGVLKFQDETGAMFMQGGAGRALTTMLASELSARPAFTVVERQKLYAVMEEQNLSASGQVSAETSIAIGKLTGAQYLITGTVTAFEDQSETRVKRGFLGYGGGVEQISHGGYLAVDLRVIDTTTGEVRHARTVEGTTPPGAPRPAGNALLSEGPDARAVRGAVLEILDYLECAMVRRDACLEAFAAKDRARQQRTREAVRVR